jgi:hypothetical protein
LLEKVVKINKTIEGGHILRILFAMIRYFVGKTFLFYSKSYKTGK